ncbi:Protein POLAR LOCALIZATION DURING ASYMMETRIC DIVISION AND REDISTRIBUTION like [Melia azedarach]|uniref:Protein POLAR LOCALIZATION DURING ASYMMETRIC DIVISION AND REDISTRIBUTION like n=1 Tax=Melia azedarach TaxID=155640 RepID=A0ACC1X8W3_MELAZ|nr:Protein POLAR LOCALIZATION DURING ASYMMETRIC DIVISION AND REDISTRIBUTION like [Melia azedarach]
MEKSSVSKSSRTHLRISDVLLIDDEEEEEEEGEDFLFTMKGFSGGRGDGCAAIVSRWLSRFRRGTVNKILVGGDEGEDKDAGESTRCSTNVFNGVGALLTAVRQNDRSGGCRCGRECSFNMGLGCSLLYLAAASKNELDKMIELRTQMEMLLKNFKEELQLRNTNTLVKPSKSNDIIVYPNPDEPERLESNCHHSRENLTTSYVLPESSRTITICEQSLKCDTPKEEECLEGIDQLQAELEAELERLQLRLDKENLLQHPRQQRVTVKDISSSRSYSFSSGEVIDPIMETQDACTEVHYGIHPYELERRLHKVVEARQQEHIRELEAALECARHKLHEKEIEISWWKDTAKLISQHIPGPLRRMAERG